MVDTGDHMGVGSDQIGANHEAGTFDNAAAALSFQLNDRCLVLIDGCLQLAK
jgi:hypothetical protein